ncbi:hypothetical protein HQ587_04060 [bacterium]|nr:hypothetical protein [bacterium]
MLVISATSLDLSFRWDDEGDQNMEYFKGLRNVGAPRQKHATCGFET